MGSKEMLKRITPKEGLRVERKMYAYSMERTVAKKIASLVLDQKKLRASWLNKDIQINILRAALRESLAMRGIDYDACSEFQNYRTMVQRRK